MAISVPQQTREISPFNYGQALIRMGEVNPLNGIAAWLTNQGNKIAERNSLDAQDYLNNLDLEAFTRAKAAGLNVLDEYAKGKYFLDKYDPAVRLAHAQAINNEKDFMLDQVSRKYTDMANRNELNGRDAKAIAESLGYYNRNSKELASLEERAQSVLDKRYSEALKQQAALAKLNNQNPNDSVRESLQKYGMTGDIGQYTSEGAIQPHLGTLVESQMQQALASLGPNPKTEDIEAVKARFLPYMSYLSPESQGKYLEGLNNIKNTSVGNRLNELYRNILNQDPEQLKGLSQDAIYNDILVPQLVREGYNLSDIYSIVSPILNGRSQYMSSFANPFEEDLATAENALSVLKQENAPLLTAINSPSKSRFNDEDDNGFNSLLSILQRNTEVKEIADALGVSQDALVRGIFENSPLQYDKYSDIFSNYESNPAIKRALESSLKRLREVVTATRNKNTIEGRYKMAKYRRM